MDINTLMQLQVDIFRDFTKRRQVAQPPAQPTACPKQYRIVPRADNEFLTMFGGRVVDRAYSHLLGWVVSIDGVERWLEADMLAEETLHDFVDTGMRRSWCRHCDAAGYFNAGSAQYKPE
jgi:hypothetical protein